MCLLNMIMENLDILEGLRSCDLCVYQGAAVKPKNA